MARICCSIKNRLFFLLIGTFFGAVFFNVSSHFHAFAQETAVAQVNSINEKNFAETSQQETEYVDMDKQPPEEGRGDGLSVSETSVSDRAGLTSAPEQIVTAEKYGKYVVLQNGSIFLGDLKLIGDKYELTTRNGVIFLPQESVAQIAENMEQIYSYRASLVFINDIQARCDLINWCFQHGMLDKVQTQLDLLRKYAPEHPLLEVFERRIELFRNRQAESLAIPTPSIQSLESESVSSFPIVRQLPMAELERMADSLPQEAIESFRKKIQPILQKNCMTIGCHGPDSQSVFRLLRVSPQMARGEVLQNLYAAVQQINLSRPEVSPLLRKPVTPHGTDSRIVFANQDYATYQLLIGWAYLVAQNRYVIPRDRLIPPTGGTPVFTPTSRGLIRISQNSGHNSGPCDMWGVDPSLYPQSLYPKEYAFESNLSPRPVRTVQPIGNTPQKFQLAFPEKESASAEYPILEEETDENELAGVSSSFSRDSRVLPASGEIQKDNSEQILPVSAEEENVRETPEPVSVPSAAGAGNAKSGNTDWEALRQAISLGIGDLKEEDVSWKENLVEERAAKTRNPMTLPDHETNRVPDSASKNTQETPLKNTVPAPSQLGDTPTQVNSEPVADWEDFSAAFPENSETSQFYAPGQNTNENPLYRPGQSSISEVHVPGRSTASNLQRGNPSMGMTGAPIAIPAPQSPASLLHGRDSVQRSNGSYHYDANSRTCGPSGSRGTLQWEQMLEMQGGAESLKK